MTLYSCSLVVNVLFISSILFPRVRTLPSANVFPYFLHFIYARSRTLS